MLWIVRFRAKESVSPAQVDEIDHYIADKAIPVLEKIDSVLSARAFHSMNSEFVFVLDLERTGAMDDVFAAEALRPITVKITEWLVRTDGAEIMWEIPAACPSGRVSRRLPALTFN